MPPTESELEAGRASAAWYLALVDFEEGKISKAALQQAAERLAAARGSPLELPVGQPNLIAREIERILGVMVEQQHELTSIEFLKLAQASSFTAEADAATSYIPIGVFYPFAQINGYFCGPATAESILFYIGLGAYRQSRAYDSIFNGYPWLQGDVPIDLGQWGWVPGPDWDQAILANTTWLKTNQNGGTNWGDMLPALNRWMGKSGGQYGTGYRFSLWTGGSGDAPGVWAQAMSSVSQGWPVAENVKYSLYSSYRPTGFATLPEYQHWDVIYGGRNENWLKIAMIGQVYGDPLVNGGRPYVTEPFQEYLWDFEYGIRPHWTALYNHHGVVLR